MKNVTRSLDLVKILSSKSCFLFGPRQTGKTSLVRQQFPKAKVFDLLESETYRRLTTHPEKLRQESEGYSLIVVDEIQRLPELLNEVHWMIENQKTRFLLTGSNAKKLRNKGVNLLGGRARSRILHPFITSELGAQFNLKKALQFGTLPSIWFSDSPWEDLGNYVSDYLTTEIAAEAVTRNVPAFSRFLETAALNNSRMINYSNMASDAEVKLSTLRNYFEILTETLLAVELKPWLKSKTRKAVATAKFYFFDVGVANVLTGRKHLSEKTTEFGEVFEAYVHHELSTRLDYQNDGSLHYWRSTSGFEVDFIVNEKIAVEVKAKSSVSMDDLKGLRALMDEKKMKKYICITLEKERRKFEGIDLIPFAQVDFHEMIKT